MKSSPQLLAAGAVSVPIDVRKCRTEFISRPAVIAIVPTTERAAVTIFVRIERIMDVDDGTPSARLMLHSMLRGAAATLGNLLEINGSRLQ